MLTLVGIIVFQASLFNSPLVDVLIPRIGGDSTALPGPTPRQVALT
jgi:hypothetical protein